jgi:hypothetical protein
MTVQEFKDIFYNGMWKQNTGVVQLLGMPGDRGGDGLVRRGDRADPASRAE